MSIPINDMKYMVSYFVPIMFIISIVGWFFGNFLLPSIRNKLSGKLHMYDKHSTDYIDFFYCNFCGKKIKKEKRWFKHEYKCMNKIKFVYLYNTATFTRMVLPLIHETIGGQEITHPLIIFNDKEEK